MQFTQKINKLYANVGKLITSSLNLEDVLEGVMGEIQTFFNPEHWSLLRYDFQSEELYFAIMKGAVELENVQNIRLKLGEGIAGYVARTREPRFVPDIAHDEFFSPRVDEETGFHTRSVIAVPLICHGKIYGVIEIVNGSEGGLFSEEEYIILKTIADFSAIAFANAELFKEVKEFSFRDSLTGLYNRARLEVLTQEMECDGIQRREQDFAIVTAIVIDLNDFKQINDTYGHQAGDQVLREFATGLRLCIRRNDWIFRQGGDEFLVLLFSQDEQRSIEAQNRVKEELDQLAIRGNGYSNCPRAFSYGMFAGSQQDIGSLIHLADAKMYEAKKEIKQGSLS